MTAAILATLKERILIECGSIVDPVTSMASGAFDDHVPSLSRRAIVGGSEEKSTLLTMARKGNYNALTFLLCNRNSILPRWYLLIVLLRIFVIALLTLFWSV